MNLLVIHMSAMGDVAMTVPAIKALLKNHKDLHITIVSRKRFKLFFKDINRLEFIAPDLENRHKGLFDLVRLFRELRKETNFEAVADLHGVLRSQIVSGLFKIKGVKVSSIDKGRHVKKSLIKESAQKSVQLKLMTERYADVFRNLGLKVELSHKLPKKKTKKIPVSVQNETHEKCNVWIGIAPFAQYEGKKYGFDKVGKLIEKLQDAYPKSKLFLFGGGKAEIDKLKILHDKYPLTIMAAGKLSLKGNWI